jgi:cellulose synthase/poly-beta-1,6-N-acetylglucosamine synthase-like glycosyltransferase
MDISLIVSTRDRCQQLSRHLDGVRAISSERLWEIIIVDNGSVDKTATVVQEFISTAPAPVSFVSDPRPGKSNALNMAVGIARGDIVAFTDDDCYPAADFIDRVWAAFQDPKLGYITGRILLHDPTDHPGAISESTEPFTFPGRSFLHAGSVMGANMAFRRSVLLNIGGFDPLFGPGAPFHAAEDVEIASRASAMGWTGQYHPEVIVRHHHERKAPEFARLLKRYSIGIGAYHMKLLLEGHEVAWFVKSVCTIRRRSRWHHASVWWETVGAAMYVYRISAMQLLPVSSRNSLMNKQI